MKDIAYILASPQAGNEQRPPAA